MENQEQNSLVCPVCSLFLREGISLRDHLQTHSKEKVIEALLKKNAPNADDNIADLLSISTSQSSNSSSHANSHLPGFNRSTVGIVPAASSFSESSSPQVTRSTPCIQLNNSNPPFINNVQFSNTLNNGMMGQANISNACTYHQIVTNEGNIVLIPVYNVGQTSVIMQNNIVTNSLVNPCVVLPSNPAQSLSVVNTSSLTASNVFNSSVNDSPAQNSDIHRDDSSNDLMTTRSNIASISGNMEDEEEKETDNEVANIFDQTLQNEQNSIDHSLEMEDDDKTSYPSTTPSIDSVLDNDVDGNVDEFAELEGRNKLIPSAAVSVIRVRSNLNFESDSSPFSMDDNDKYDQTANHTNSSTEPFSPIVSPVKSDAGSLSIEPANDSDKCDSYASSFNENNQNIGILETQSNANDYDFVISNSDNAMHILSNTTDESLKCMVRRNTDQYILPNDEIPRNCVSNSNNISDYNFLGVRNSFLSSASLISSVNKTMFADVDIYNSVKSKSDNEDLANEGAKSSSEAEDLSVIVASNRDNAVEIDLTGQNSCNNVESVGSSRISPFNIQTDESMPPRGELSGQGSLCETKNALWETQVQLKFENVKMACARDSKDMKIDLHTLISDINGVQDSANFNINENLMEESKLSVAKITSCSSGSGSSSNKKVIQREFICFYCRVKFDSWKERQSHIAEVHSKEDGLTIESLFGKRLECKRETVKTEEHEEPDGENADNPSYILCRICNESFESTVALLKHLKVLHGIRKRSCICPTCFVRFACANEYQQHIQKVHPYECMTCGKKFHTRPGYMLHQKRHMKIKPYSCNDCDKSFVTKQKLVEHVNVHTGENPIKCELCDCQFKRYSNYQQHKKYLHLNQKRKLKDFVCNCGEVFHSKVKLLWHQEIHDEKPKQCPFCVERFVHTGSLTRHVRKWHNETYISEWVAEKKMNMVECPVCNVSYLQSSLQTHMKIHDDVKPFACTECSRSFRTKWNLQLHKWTHSSRSAKPFKCKLCVKAYIHKMDYDAHMRSHNNCRPYACNVCGRQFIRKYNCIRHMREHKEPRGYKCNVCGKLFSRSYYLSEHEKVHTGEKPHVCHICGKASATKSNHNKHVKMHNVVRESVNSES